MESSLTDTDRKGYCNGRIDDDKECTLNEADGQKNKQDDDKEGEGKRASNGQNRLTRLAHTEGTESPNARKAVILTQMNNDNKRTRA